MKWLCKIRHNWHYTKNKQPLKTGHLSLLRRRCLRCHIVEIQSILDNSWNKTTPTIEELREINLKRLGI